MTRKRKETPSSPIPVKPYKAHKDLWNNHIIPESSKTLREISGMEYDFAVKGRNQYVKVCDDLWDELKIVWKEAIAHWELRNPEEAQKIERKKELDKERRKQKKIKVGDDGGGVEPEYEEEVVGVKGEDDEEEQIQPLSSFVPPPPLSGMKAIYGSALDNYPSLFELIEDFEKLYDKTMKLLGDELDKTNMHRAEILRLIKTYSQNQEDIRSDIKKYLY